MEYQQYITTENERWDQIAGKAYGNSNLIDGIIAANPNVAIADVLPGGVVLQIPIIPEDEAENDLSLLPPWKVI